MWSDKLKEAGVSIHIVATGAGAGLQNKLWGVPGSSTYLSGASFPYAQEEQVELLGFTPEHYCSPEAAVDLASVAYMKAYRFGGKKPVGVGITASVASEKEHRGSHRGHVVVMTDDKVLALNMKMEKGKGEHQRMLDGALCNNAGFFLLQEAIGIEDYKLSHEDATALARERFMMRPYFTSTGTRHSLITDQKRLTLMPGAFNPPHEGHFGMADLVREQKGDDVVFEVTSDPPHKDALTVQDLLKRAKLLQGRNRFFSVGMPRYLDKARKYPKSSLVLGADAVVRMLDPKWGFDIDQMLAEFYTLGTTFYIFGRNIDGKFTTRDDILNSLPREQEVILRGISYSINGEWDISSTELRNKIK